MPCDVKELMVEGKERVSEGFLFFCLTFIVFFNQTFVTCLDSILKTVFRCGGLGKVQFKIAPVE